MAGLVGSLAKLDFFGEGLGLLSFWLALSLEFFLVCLGVWSLMEMKFCELSRLFSTLLDSEELLFCIPFSFSKTIFLNDGLLSFIEDFLKSCSSLLSSGLMVLSCLDFRVLFSIYSSKSLVFCWPNPRWPPLALVSMLFL